MDNKLLSLQDAAMVLKVHPETLRRWDREGKLTAVKVGSRGDRFYRFEDIQKFMLGLRSIEYKGFLITPHSPGFEMFVDRFGEVASFVVNKGADLAVGFAFAIAGLERMSTPHITDQQLLDKAIEKIKKYIDDHRFKHLDELTFEYRSGDYYLDENAIWWKKGTL